MAFIDKLGQVANKVGSVAGDTFDYGKAKGKIVLEKGKIRDGKEALGEYIYGVAKAGDEIDMERVKQFCAEIDEHVAQIDRLEAEAKQSGADIAGAFAGDEKDVQVPDEAVEAEVIDEER